MRTVLIALIIATGVFAQDFIPFNKKLTPEWQKKIVNAGITREIEYINTPGFDVKDGELPAAFVSAVYDEKGKLQFVAEKLKTEQYATEYEYLYDDKGYLESIEVKGKDNNGAPTKSVYSFVYEGKRLSYIAVFEDQKQGASVQWLYEYGSNGKLESITQKTFESEDSGLFNVAGTYFFDSYGRLSRTKFEADEVTYVYDSKGRLEKEVIDFLGVPSKVEYTYDVAGNLLKSAKTSDSYSSIETYTLDELGFPLSKTVVTKSEDMGDENDSYIYYYE